MESQQTNKEFQRQYFEDFSREHAGIVRSHLIKKLSRFYQGNKVLEVGSAHGKLLDLIPGAIGIDLAPKHPKVQKGDITKTDFESNYFDTIFALEVLEHLDNETLDKAIKEIARILKPSGYFVVTTPYEEDLKQKFTTCSKCNHRFHHQGHVRSVSKDFLEKIFTKEGLEMVKFQVLPLGFLARHSFLGSLWKLFNFLGLGSRPMSIFAVARKTHD